MFKLMFVCTCLTALLTTGCPEQGRYDRVRVVDRERERRPEGADRDRRPEQREEEEHRKP
jgi:hypothetical protein